jgi:cardiolipin synthase
MKSGRRWLLLIAVSLPLVLAACSSLPRVDMPVLDGNAPAAQIVRADASMSPAPEKLHEAKAEGRAAHLERHIRMLGTLGEVSSADNEVSLLIDGPATFAAIFAALESARTSIQMESYIFEDAALGERVAQVLKQKAQQGVRVRLIYDAIGSFSTAASFFDDLARAGVQVCEFNPVRPKLFGDGRLNHRDHRKIVIADDKVAITGGINISDVYSAGSASFIRSSHKAPAKGNEAAPKKGWRDSSVRVRGPAVADFSSLFANTWQRQNCADPPVPALRQARSLAGDRLVTVIGSTPDDPEPRIYRALLTAIGGARQSIHMTMSYFVPDPQSVDFLVAVARRGVDVRLLLQGTSDSVLVLRAGQSHYTTLLSAGVRIFERSDTLLHAKTTVIDGVWSTIGSSNVDWRSFLHNDEVNVIVFGADFGREMEAMFERDLQQAQEITPALWAERGFSRRLMERLGRLFEYWL